MAHAHRAFTLIELLVVIAIVSILAAIIFSVYALARERGRQTTCLSNERQLTQAILTYTQDYDEYLPPIANNDVNPQGFNLLWPDIINPYVRSTGLYLCPSDNPEAAAAASMNEFYSYGLNELAFTDFTDLGAPPPLSLGQFNMPDSTIMLTEIGTGKAGNLADVTTPYYDADKVLPPDADLDINDYKGARPSARHFSRANVSFMDGHVKAMALGQFYVGQTPSDKWFTP